MNLQAAFIYIGPDLEKDNARAVIDNGGICLNVCGVKNYAEAEEVAREMAAKGVGAIELCGGFGNDGIARIQKAAGPEVAVGAVKFPFHPGLGFKSGDDFFE
ncbi:MAG: DUF6506 family protein [Eubacteriaceae bacterium]|jgi:hypothetical protein|nr:DUF6506 family protein [Eubacteriaceae bacterium]